MHKDVIAAMAVLANLFNTIPKSFLVVTGSGAEMDLTLPNVSHALCVHILVNDGAVVTTNVTDLLLLTMTPEANDFVAVHGTLLDYCDRLRSKESTRNLRSCIDDLPVKSLEIPDPWPRGLTIPIPIKVQGSVFIASDNNFIDAVSAASDRFRTNLLIIGNSLSAGSNGAALRFFSSAPQIVNVFFVNPDVTYTKESAKALLKGWGLPDTIKVRTV